MNDFRLIDCNKIPKEQDITLVESWSELKKTVVRLSEALDSNSVRFSDLTNAKKAISQFEMKRAQPLPKVKPKIRNHFILHGTCELQKARALLTAATRRFGSCIIS